MVRAKSNLEYNRDFASKTNDEIGGVFMYIVGFQSEFNTVKRNYLLNGRIK